MTTLLCSIGVFVDQVTVQSSEDCSDSENDITMEADTSGNNLKGTPCQEFPRMPCTPARQKHRDKNPAVDLVNACVARPVRPAEVKTNPKAQKAMQLEWNRLRAVPRDGGKAVVWDESLVRECRHVRN